MVVSIEEKRKRRAEQQRVLRHANPERYREYQRKSRVKREAERTEEEKEAIAKRRRELAYIREQTPYWKTYRAKYMEEHKVEAYARSRKWIAENPERHLSVRQRYDARWPFMRLLGKSRMRAKAAGLEHNLTKEWARARWTGKCELTGAEFKLTKGNQNAFSPSIDRIDSSKGYTQDNCRIVLWAVNRFKGDESDEIMRQIARLIVGN